MTKLVTHIAQIALTLLFSAHFMLAHAQSSPLGVDVVNVAEVSYDHPSGRHGFDTNEAVFRIVAKVTPSTIQFYRHAPGAPDAVPVNLHGSDYSPTGGTGSADFFPVAADGATHGAPIDFSQPVQLTEADSYFAGEMLIVRVTDKGQNGNSGLIETVIITIEAETGDMVTLRLYESAPDSGEFFGYIPSTESATARFDSRLTTQDKSRLKAQYVDLFDSTEVSVDTALVDPYGRIFDSLTGEYIDGATVTIVHAATGQPADVYGLDGMSAYPSTLVTGTIVTDASGAVYELEPGEFLFPLMRPGQYRLEVTPPEGFVFPSGFTPVALATVPNGPFELIDGSYGLEFTVSATGPLHFDVPVDTSRGLTVVKEAATPSAAIGDFVPYTVRVENTHDAALPLRVEDVLPRGFRYQDGSARLDGSPVGDPDLSADGRTLYFDGGVIASGETRSFAYVLAVGAGAANGEAVNQARAVNPNNRPISNTAEAAVTIREDLLRSESTIIGRVSSDACEPEAEWAREVETAEGVQGVRVYMETGEFAITDEQGQFHFQGVAPGTHVVQIDPATLPAGYEPVICEENSRYAGSAISKFVDAMGGTIWRANFYLRKTFEVEVGATAAETSDVTEYLDYDQAWLDQQEAGIAWVYPATDRTPSSRSVNIGIKMPLTATVELSLNGRPVPAANRQSRISSSDQSLALRRWRGVDIEIGANLFEATLTLQDGTRQSLQHTVWFVTEAQRARLVDDQSLLVADGRTTPVLAVRLENAEGRAVHASRIVEIDVPAPYRLKSEDRLTQLNPVASIATEARGVTVGADGIARVELEPTLRTGRIRVRVPLANGQMEEIDAYLRPEQRDWILVGLAEGELAQLDTDETWFDQDGNWNEDGRLAFFAKGMIRGDWLLTVAVDTTKRRGASDRELYDAIDPNAYYTLYGDRAVQGHDAESRYPVYVKLERETTQFLFGDFATDLNDTELSRYSRQLTGLRAVTEGENVSASAFIAETNQGFVMDEIAADGTSGPYRLSQSAIVRNSETVRIETRDRDRPDQVISVRSMERHVDYELDYHSGEIVFRAPVDASDVAFNDNVIVVDYETYSEAERNLTYGGRASIISDDDRFQAGVSFIHEEGSDEGAEHSAELAGVDVEYRLNAQTEVRAEYAITRSDTPLQDNGAQQAGRGEADAYLLEVDYRSEAIGAQAYLREEEAGFGLGQTGSNTRSIRRIGGQASARLQETTESETGNRVSRSLTGQVYQETALDTNESRRVGELMLNQSGMTLNGGIGLRAVSEDLNSGDSESVLATAQLSKVFPDLGLTLTASHEQPLGNKNEAVIAPQRTILGVDKSIGERLVLNLRHEITDGAHASGNNTLMGVTYLPWTGGRLTGDLNQITQDSADRLTATVGLDQTFRISEAWSASLGAARRSRVSGGVTGAAVLADDPVSPFEEGFRSPLLQDDDFTSAYLGLGYREETTALSARLEHRDGVLSTRTAFILGGARELSEALSYAGGARLQEESTAATAPIRSAEALLGLAWRPAGGDTAFLNRLDFNRTWSDLHGDTWKLVNNAGLNLTPSDRTQVSLFHGLKYSEARFSGQQLSGWTNLAGLEVRHDIRRNVDVGLRASYLHSSATRTGEYQIGPSIGITPRDNVWISLGYNLVGFADDDFEAAAYTRNGLFIKFRMKFDQTDTEDLLDWVSPEGRN